MLSLPFVQTKIANYITKSVNENLKTNISIGKVDLSYLGNVSLKDVKIRDHHKDTLIFVNKLSTSILNARQVVSNKVNLKSISLEGVDFFLKTYKGEDDDNLAVFIKSLESDKPKDSLSGPFILKSDNIYIYDLHFRLSDDNKEKPLNYEVYNLGGNLQNFLIEGPNFESDIRGLYFKDLYGLEISNLSTDFKYSKVAMHFNETTIETKNSKIIADIDFLYKRKELSDFNNKVKIKANFKNSILSIKDLNKFYKELQGDDVITFSSLVKGNLNRLKLKNLDLSSRNGIKIVGDLSFKNLINTEKGFSFKSDLKNLTATQKQLKKVLPNILGKTLPTEFEKFGKFTIVGNIHVSPEDIWANIDLDSEIGFVQSDLTLTNIDEIDNAQYQGYINFKDFNIGKLFNDPLFNLITLNGDINGEGFKLDNINTSFIGAISRLDFNDYSYTNIKANGQYQNNKFDGFLTVDDKNLKMNFNGLADLSSEINKFDFDSEISYLNLKETNIFTRDSISELKGKINIDIDGNNFDNITGAATFNDVFYTNEKKQFDFKEFKISSTLKDKIKKIEVDSKDIVNGFVEGDFIFSDFQKLAQNSLGSMYTNYKPFVVKENQFIDFDFTLYNQIISVFFPEVEIDDNTRIKGKISSNKDLFKLTFLSPRINVYGNELINITLRTDTQNKFYNTYFSSQEINTKYYNASNFSLINKNQNDTLFFKSKFTGSKINEEDFNLDFYYTINKDQKSVLAFENSTFIYKDTPWSLNPDRENTDKIIFDLNNNEFNFSKFKVTSGNQKIEFEGNLKGDSEKELLADFTKVQLKSFLPEIDSLSLGGEVSGSIDFIQKEDIYKPEAILLIKDFQVNDFNQGDLAINIKGDNSYEKFNVDLSIDNKNVKSIAATGYLDFSNNRPLIDLQVFLEEYQINAFSPLGKDVISSLRGNVSGQFDLRGFLRNPDMEGVLTLNNAGLKFPYLNIDFDFDEDSTISLTEQSFILENLNLTDTKHQTKGILSGNISHQNFEKWFLDLKIKGDNLLVLDTENTDEALYYGTAFIEGTGLIYGLTDQLSIEVNAKTKENSKFVVPLKDIETVDSFSLIHFQSDNLKVEERQRQVAQESIKGLSLILDLDITKDALAQVVIDEEFGSQLMGRGDGNLRIEINTRGKFEMYGDYSIDSGVYDFKYGGIINKPFIIQKGGTVSWSGSPYDANLDVVAIYKAKANPAVLLENFNSNRKEEIDLVTRITGGLFSSKQELDIQLTNVDPTIASELEFVLNDNNINEKTTQFISLLAFGTFRNPDKVNFDVNSTLSGTASSAIANAFSNLLNSPDSKFQLGLDYQQGESGNNIDRLNIDDQFDVSVSTQLNDRIIINGKVGVPVGAQTQSSVVGEVKVEVLLNRNGNFRGVIFNRQNEIQYSQQEEGYTQGFGLSYQVNFNTLSDLLSKMGFKKKQNKEIIKKDSLKLLKPNFNNFEGN